MSIGWICVHRKMLDWEWFDDPNVFRLFMYLLLSANHKEKNWKGVVVSKGSLITGRESLALKTGLSVQQIRTAINKLKSTNEITIKTTSKNSLISIVKWNEYQGSNQQVNQPATSNQPASNQQVTTNNNDNNNNNEIKEKNNVATEVATLPKKITESELSAKEVSSYLAKKILTVNSTAKLKPNSWVADIEKSIRIDERTKDGLIDIIKWIYTPEGNFWVANIMSGKKLREKFDTLQAQKNQRTSQSNAGFPKTKQSISHGNFSKQDYGESVINLPGFANQ